MVAEQDILSSCRNVVRDLDAAGSWADYEDGFPTKRLRMSVVVTVQFSTVKRVHTWMLRNYWAVISAIADKHGIEDLRCEGVIDEIFGDHLENPQC